jgi:hypothetical protein
MARSNRDVSRLTLYGPYTEADDATALAPGVWYNVNDSGVMFKHYNVGDWLIAIADYQLITGGFDWDKATPPFAQSCIAGGCRVNLHCNDNVTYLSIEHEE